MDVRKELSFCAKSKLHVLGKPVTSVTIVTSVTSAPLNAVALLRPQE